MYHTIEKARTTTMLVNRIFFALIINQFLTDSKVGYSSAGKLFDRD